MVPQTTDFRCERTRRKQYAPPRRGIKTELLATADVRISQRRKSRLTDFCNPILDGRNTDDFGSSRRCRTFRLLRRLPLLLHFAGLPLLLLSHDLRERLDAEFELGVSGGANAGLERRFGGESGALGRGECGGVGRHRAARLQDGNGGIY